MSLTQRAGRSLYKSSSTAKKDCRPCFKQEEILDHPRRVFKKNSHFEGQDTKLWTEPSELSYSSDFFFGWKLFKCMDRSQMALLCWSSQLKRRREAWVASSMASHAFLLNPPWHWKIRPSKGKDRFSRRNSLKNPAGSMAIISLKESYPWMLWKNIPKQTNMAPW